MSCRILTTVILYGDKEYQFVVSHFVLSCFVLIEQELNWSAVLVLFGKVLSVITILVVGKYDRISAVLSNFHWLPVFYRIFFKILVSTFKAIHGMSPSYINDLVSIRTCSSYSLRSHHSIVLEHPKGRMLATFSARSFSVSAAAPTLRNSISPHIRDIGSLCAFKKQVKTNLFRLAFT